MTNSERDKVNGRLDHCLIELRILQSELRRQDRGVAADIIRGAIGVVQAAQANVQNLNAIMEAYYKK